jgi:hypothetical protein
MELFLNLCWLSLLLPAYLLWRRRALVASVRTTGRHAQITPLVFMCVLGCALVLLFPVISASDDLHAMRPEMEESERAFRHIGHCACATHVVVHDVVFALPGNVTAAPQFEEVGLIVSTIDLSSESPSVLADFGRAPPVELNVLFV